MKFSIRKWANKYKLPHIAAWLIVSFLFMFTNVDYNVPLLPQWIPTFIGFGLLYPASVYAARKLVPKYLYQKKISLFIVHNFLLAFANSVITYLITFFIYHLLTGAPMFRSLGIIVSIGLSILSANILSISATCIIKIIKDRYFMEQQLFETEKEKISTELNFLRSQVNPHFLFNVMNTIYFQIDKQNIQARASVEKFSEMLRYQLYECTSDKIEISKEMEYIRNYIAIQTLRMEQGTNIQLNISPNLSGFYIAPLLLLPLIENAFKHISNYKEAGQNKIKISVQQTKENFLLMDIFNTFDQTQAQLHILHSGGLGIQNLKRRLELLYEDKYDLKISRDENTFHTVLKLQYHD